MRRGTPHPGVTDVAGARPDTSLPDTLPSHWYALWVMSNAEFVIRDALDAHGMQVFLPTWSEVTQWSDRKKTIERPLFPGYLFARANREQLMEAVRTAGVIEILPTSMTPAPVDRAEVENVRLMLAAGLPLKLCPYASGDEVLIDRGPLAGVKGVVQRTKNGMRVIVKVEILHRAVCVEVDADELVKQEKKAA